MDWVMDPDEFNAQAFKVLLERGGACQQFYVTADWLRSHMWDRGILLPFDGLERLEEEQLVMPMLRVRARSLSLTGGAFKHWAENAEAPRAGDYVPWTSFRKNGITTTEPLYHPLQFHVVRRAVRQQEGSVAVSALMDWCGQDLAKFQEAKREAMATDLERLRVETGRWYALALLLLHIQDAYLPRIRGVVKGSDGPGGGAGAHWQRWRGEFAPDRVMGALDIDTDCLHAARERVFRRGKMGDPLRRWAHLVRLARFRKRGELRGNALLAQDYYDIADVLSYFLEDLTGECQPRAADLFDASWPELQVNLYGATLMSRERKALTRHLGEFGLVPQARVALLTEGETEANFFPRLCKEMLGVGMEQAGIWHQLLGGANLLGSKVLRRLLDRLKWAGTLVHVVVDNDPRVQTQIDDLVRCKLLRRCLCTVWERTFLQEFPAALIADALCDALAEKYPEGKLRREAVAIVREAAADAQDYAGVQPFEEPLRRLAIHVKSLEPALGSALAQRVANAWRSGELSEEFPPVRRLVQVLRNVALDWHEWSGFPEDQPTLP